MQKGRHKNMHVLQSITNDTWHTLFTLSNYQIRTLQQLSNYEMNLLRASTNIAKDFILITTPLTPKLFDKYCDDIYQIIRQTFRVVINGTKHSKSKKIKNEEVIHTNLLRAFKTLNDNEIVLNFIKQGGFLIFGNFVSKSTKKYKTTEFDHVVIIGYKNTTKVLVWYESEKRYNNFEKVSKKFTGMQFLQQNQTIKAKGPFYTHNISMKGKFTIKLTHNIYRRQIVFIFNRNIVEYNYFTVYKCLTQYFNFGFLNAKSKSKIFN